MNVCEICNAVCRWEPGKPVCVPADVTEAKRRIKAHMRAIVHGAGRKGITVRALHALFADSYNGPDADHTLFSPNAIEAA